jgi:preprotein translocase subunit SecB
MDKDKQPGIRFNGIILVEEKFWRDYIIPEDAKLDLKLESGNNKLDNSYNVELKAILRLIKDDKETLTLESRFVGFFTVIKGSENMDIDEYIKNNAPALMFPYVREHISAITIKAGIKPILVPPLNMRALLKKQQNNISE